MKHNESKSTPRKKTADKPLLKSCETVCIDLKKFNTSKRLLAEKTKVNDKVPEKKQVCITYFLYY